ncbi:MAG: FN3 domain-containing metallophosphoesterase family protein, partial [Fibrobacterota bacterium]
MMTRHGAILLLALFICDAMSLSLVQGPQVGNVTDSTITFSWFTDSAAGSRVDYGTASNSLTLSVEDTHSVQWHVIQAVGLSAGTRVFYRVHSGSSQSSVFFCKTLPGVGKPFRFGSFGDTHGGTSITLAAPLLVLDSCDFFFNIGDVVGANNVPETTAFQACLNYKKRSDSLEHYVPVYETFGNHEAYG